MAQIYVTENREADDFPHQIYHMTWAPWGWARCQEQIPQMLKSILSDEAFFTAERLTKLTTQ